MSYVPQRVRWRTKPQTGAIRSNRARRTRRDSIVLAFARSTVAAALSSQKCCAAAAVASKTLSGSYKLPQSDNRLSDSAWRLRLVHGAG